MRDGFFIVRSGLVTVGGSDGFSGESFLGWVDDGASQWWAGTLAVEGEAKARAGLAFVVAHPPKTGEDGAPAWVAGMGRQKLGCATRLDYRCQLTHKNPHLPDQVFRLF